MSAELKQGTQEWLSARIGKLTGSRVGAILGVNPYSNPDDVMREMVREHFGAEREFTGNAATEHGNEYEDVALQDYELYSGNEVTAAGLLVHPHIDWLAVSPDGLIGADGGVEIKCPYSGKIKDLDDQPHYKSQVLLCLAVTGREWWDFYVWTEGGESLETAFKDEAESWLENNITALEEFHDRYMEIITDENLAKPYLADLEADASGDETWQALAAEYESAKRKSDEAEAHLKECKAKLSKHAETYGTKKVKGCGVQVYKATRKGSVQYGKIPELKDVDLEKYRGKDSEYWTVKNG